MAVTDTARDAAFNTIAKERETITHVCREIHNDPETALEEYRASERLTGLLERYGFTVQRGIAGLPTAFHARFDRIDSEAIRKGGRHAHVGLIAEYDALPAVGHAHGHPLGTAVILATAVGLQAALANEFGTVSVFGCPGTAVSAKLQLTRAGVFAPLDAVIGAHPAPPGEGFFYTIDSSGNTIGSAEVTISYRGDGDQPAATARFRDAFETVPPPTRVGETVTIRDHVDAVLVLEVRAGSRKRIVDLLVALKEMAGSVSEADGQEVIFSVANVYDDMIVSRVIARRMNTYAFNLGFQTDKSYKMPVGEPSEWGNVSYETPTFQAFFPVSSVPIDAAWGEASFTEAAKSDDAFNQAFTVAEAMSFTALDIIRDIDFRAIADNQLVKALALRGETRAHRRWTGLHPVRPKETTNGTKTGPQLRDFRIVRQSPNGGSNDTGAKGGDLPTR